MPLNTRWLPRRRWARYLVLGAIGLFVLVLVLGGIRQWILFPEVALQSILAEEPLNMPTHLAEFPDGSGDMAVTEKEGRILWFHRGAARAEGVLVDLTGRVAIKGYEDGLLSIAFHPRFAENGWFYAAYTANKPLRLEITRFTARGPERAVSPGDEAVILEITKPGPNHNGGTIVFGPDGMMYLSVGDSQYGEHGQNLKTPHGSILRIDVDHPGEPRNYGIPKDNPFVDAKEDVRAEIWAYGFRNVWRFSIDPVTGTMWAGDVGSERFEEINRVTKGGNYGWAVLEGEECVPPEAACDRSQYIAPVAALPRFIMRAVIGGYVYRGERIPWLRGTYVFGDLFRGVYGIPEDAEGVISVPDALLFRPRALHGPNEGHEIRLASMAEDLARELYLIDLKGGLYRIVPR